MHNREDLCPCGRLPRGFGYMDRNTARQDQTMINYCSMEHMKMRLTLNQREKDAVAKTSPKAGKFLTDLGVTDMAEMTPVQWHDFLEFVYVTTCDESIPF